MHPGFCYRGVRVFFFCVFLIGDKSIHQHVQAVDACKGANACLIHERGKKCSARQAATTSSISKQNVCSVDCEELRSTEGMLANGRCLFVQMPADGLNI